MAIDPRIALGVKNIELPAPTNNLAQYAQMQQIQSGQAEQQMNALKMQEYERTRTEEEGARNYLSGADLTKPETRTGLLKFGKTGMAYGKALTEADTAQTAQQKSQFDLSKAKREFVAQAQRDTSRNPSDANITAFKEDLMMNPAFTDAEKTQMVAGADRNLAMPVEQRQAFMASQGASSGELKPTITSQSLGGASQIMSTPAFGGAATVVPGSLAQQQPFSPEIEAQKARIALAGRAPRAESTPVAVLGPNGTPILVSREQSMGMTPANAFEKPMTQAQKIKYTKDKVSDKDVVAGALAVTNELEKLTDELVGNPDKKIAPAPGLGGITGYAGLLPSLPKGDARKAEQKLETFKGKIMALGRQLASQEGKLGNMAVQEWKFVSDAVQKIDPAAGNLDVQMRDVVRQAKEYSQRQQSKYEDTYADDPTTQRGGAAPPTTNAITNPNFPGFSVGK
jgi:hypothetical protein